MISLSNPARLAYIIEIKGVEMLADYYEMIAAAGTADAVITHIQQAKTYLIISLVKAFCYIKSISYDLMNE